MWFLNFQALKNALHSYPKRLLGWKKFARHGTFISQFYTHQSTTFWRKQNFLTRAFFSTDQLVVLPYKAKWHLRGQITKGSTFSSDRMLWNHSYSISLYPTSEKKCGHFLNTHRHWIRRGERKKNPILLLTYSQIWFSSFLIQFWDILKKWPHFFS